MPNTEFVHLNCCSEYSIKNSLIRIPKLVEQVKSMGMKSIALTDESNLFAAIKFYKAAIKTGIKPIFAAKITIKIDERTTSAILLCQNHQGYLNLSQLISDAYLQGQNIHGVSITTEQLVNYQRGLIMITLPITGDVAQHLLAGQIKQARLQAQFYHSVFGNRFYLGAQRTEREYDEKHLHLCLELGLSLGIPLVALNDVQFLHAADFEAHEARICISQGGLLDNVQRKKHYSNQQYLKSADEMGELFADLPELLQNSVEISKRCNLHFALDDKHYLPEFIIPKKMDTAEFLTQKSQTGLDNYLQNLNTDKDIYQNRLAFELSVIMQMNFSGYFLIVADFIHWSKQNNIPVGPGRGSGAGSLVAFVLGITNVDPIKHGLLFERFLNPERISMPDFDIDFCTDRRDEVIEYVTKKYGSEKVSQIITYGTMAAKGVVRDVGRVLGHPYGFSDKLSKLIPNDLQITLPRALGIFANDDNEEAQNRWYSPELKAKYDSDPSVTTLIDLSLKLEGLVRNVSTHAGGVVIAPNKISSFCPIYKGSSEDDVVVSQFDKNDVEAVGLVKFDFLGLSSLTIIDKTVKTIFAKGLSSKLIDLDALTLDDKLVYELLQRADTTGIFQMESDGMRAYLKKLVPNCFADIVDMLALYRPGAMDYIDNYVSVKHGKQDISYPHPLLEEILKPTNGVFVYQEQVMLAAQIMAGYSLGGADLLRRAMSKKNAKEMTKQRSVFVKGAAKKQITNDKANEVFDYIDKFAGYGFNKSHSVAYAYISYQTAFLKAHYPAAFMASVLSGFMDDTDKIAFVVSEVLQMGLKIDQPNVLQSDYNFTIKDAQTIVYGLGAIKGVGSALVDILIKDRTDNGNYHDLFDFCLRISKKALNRRAIEALIYSGALDVFAVNRARLIATYPAAIKQAEQRQNDDSTGQNSLFCNTQAHTEYEVHYLDAATFSFKQKLQLEKSVMGYYFYDHPTDEFKPDLKYIGAVLPKDLIFRNNKEVCVLALIADLRYRSTKNAKQIVNIVLEDSSKKINAVVFNQTLGLVSDQLIDGEVVLIHGKVNKDFRGEWQLVVNAISNIDEVKARYANDVEITLNAQQQAQFAPLSALLKQHPGTCPVSLLYQQADTEGQIRLSADYRVVPNQQLIDSVDNLLGVKISKIRYQGQSSE